MRRRQCGTNSFETECDYDTEVTKSTDMMQKCLEDDIRKQRTPRRSHISTIEAFVEEVLEMISGLYGRNDRPTTLYQRKSGRKVGIAVSQKHCVYRKFLRRHRSMNYV